MPKVLLLTKTDRFSQAAHEIARKYFPDVTIISGKVGSKLPEEAKGDFDYIISFLCPWIIPAAMLQKAKLALNFHPGTTEYPGFGCYNFALYHEAKEFGCVCHHMIAKVDAGELVAESRFPLTPEDTVDSLKLKTMNAMVPLFENIMKGIAEGKPLPKPGLKWQRPAYTKKELEALGICTVDMKADEIKRRIRATSYPGFHTASVIIDGIEFFYPPPTHTPLA